MTPSFSICNTLALVVAVTAVASAQVSPIRTLRPSGLGDIDDSVFWIHPSDRSQSTVILSDKLARRIFVMRPDGSVLQTITTAPTGQGPGNIDLRYGIPFAGGSADLVVTTNRQTDQLDVYRVDPATGMLERVDDGAIAVAHAKPVYGVGLYRSPTTNKLFAIVTQNGTGAMEQIELYDNAGKISGRQVRAWTVASLVEGVVADEANGRVFYAEEDVGVWTMDGEPDAPRPGAKLAGLQVGENGLVNDLEGVTIYHHGDGTGYLLVSSQGNNTFKVFDRRAPHAHVGSFSITNTGMTDGIDVTPIAIGTEFLEGAFTAHNGQTAPYPTELLSWADIRAAVPGIVAPPTPGWDPRGPREPGGDDAGVDDVPDAEESAAGCGCAAERDSAGGGLALVVLVGVSLLLPRPRRSVAGENEGRLRLPVSHGRSP